MKNLVLSTVCIVLSFALLGASVTSPQAGIEGTIPAHVYDGDPATFFKTGFNNWQYVELDLGASRRLTGIRRTMSGPGNRTSDGEAVQISTNGTSWTYLTGPTTFGWNSYLNYGANLHAWRSVPYGWSAWLRPNTSSTIRYLRFHWDGNNDVLNELELDSRLLSSDRTGLSGTTPWNTIDENTSTGFQTGYTNWQHVLIDFGAPVTLVKARRHMSAGSGRTGQGEGFSYSYDGVTWMNFTASGSTGWEPYVNYAPHAWHSVPYGWSNWLTLNDSVPVRYVRYNWDGNWDTLNEVEIDYLADHGDPSYDFVPGEEIFEDNFESEVQTFWGCSPPATCGFESSGARYETGFSGTYYSELYPFPYSGDRKMANLRLRDTGDEVRGVLTLLSPLAMDAGTFCGTIEIPAGTEISVHLLPWTSYDGRFSSFDSTYSPALGDVRYFAEGSTTREVGGFLTSGQVTLDFHAMIQIMHIGAGGPAGSLLAADIEIDPPWPCNSGTIDLFGARDDDLLRRSLGYSSF